MKKGLLLTLSTIILMSCTKNESNVNLAQLQDKFHGKYEVISSTSTDAVDLNMDGISSTDLLDENSEIARSGLEIRIYNDYSFSFEEKWPVEYFIPGNAKVDSTSYQSTFTINYALYCNVASFQFADHYKSIQLLGNLNQADVNTLKSVESIVIEENEIIKVTTIRKLYTKKGWVTTKIESRYKRYTSIT